MPDEMEVHGLLALMLLHDARRGTRIDAGGDLVLLADQDRSRWDQALAAEGRAIAAACVRRGLPGPYQLQACIQAVHSEAATAADTDWTQIVQIYDQLMALAPSPVVALNRAVALAEVEGPAAGLAVLEGLDLDRYHLFHAARADLLLRLDRSDAARAAYERALELTGNAAERRFLTERLAALG
jgi:RNA polymerase sigma-70 factor (ECF subfamily)